MLSMLWSGSGMLNVCLGERATGEPDEPAIREIEGWILGREP